MCVCVLVLLHCVLANSVSPFSGQSACLRALGYLLEGNGVNYVTLGLALKKPLPLGSEEVGRGADDEWASRAEHCQPLAGA